MRNYLPHSELSARIFDAAIRPRDLDVIEEHATRKEPRATHVRPCSDASQLELRGAVAREVLAIAAPMFDDAEAVAPLLTEPTERFALVDEASTIKRRDPILAHRGDVDPRERLQERTEDRFVERWRAPERAELENRFEHDTAV